jgi:hypothetical protein
MNPKITPRLRTPADLARRLGVSEDYASGLLRERARHPYQPDDQKRRRERISDCELRETQSRSWGTPVARMIDTLLYDDDPSQYPTP